MTDMQMVKRLGFIRVIQRLWLQYYRSAILYVEVTHCYRGHFIVLVSVIVIAEAF